MFFFKKLNLEKINLVFINYPLKGMSMVKLPPKISMELDKVSTYLSSCIKLAIDIRFKS